MSINLANKIILNPFQKNTEVQQNKNTNSPRTKMDTNKIMNSNKRYSRPINAKDFQTKNMNLKQESKFKNKTRSSKSLPKLKKDSNKMLDEKEYKELEKIKIKSESKTNSFCKAFFIVSFSKNNNKIIENSEGILSDCGHEECSVLPAFDPEIVYKYPEKDSKELEINNILASISFPNYIKVCFFEEEDKIYSFKDYGSCFTNQIGDRYYAMMCHFYTRMTNNDFCQAYNTNLFDKITIKNSGEIDENDESKAIINDIKKRQFIYIPHCLGLISKYPYFSQMEKCLQSIMITLNNSNLKNNDLIELIEYLVKSIPSPYINTSISFPVPNSNKIIELNPCFYQEMSLYENNLIILLEKLSVKSILILFRLLLLEQKVLLISSDYKFLTQISVNLISLLYPLTYVQIYIPIITRKMLKYLQSFLPFFAGINKSLYEQEKVQNTIKSFHKDLVIFDIDNNKFEISCNIGSKKRVNPIKFINKNIPTFPKKIEDIIVNQLNRLNTLRKDDSLDDNNNIILNIKIRLLFSQVFIELLSDYKRYLSIIDDIPVFNTLAFLKEKLEADKNFYKELTTTQSYQVFIQSSFNYINKNKKNFYFDDLIDDYKRFKKKYNSINIIGNEKLINDMNDKLYKINKTYIIRPSYMSLFKNIDTQLKTGGKKLFDDINFYLKKEFKEPNILNAKGILKENKRIIYNDINISKANELKEFEYYITKEESMENENKEDLKNKQMKTENESKDNNSYNNNEIITKDSENNILDDDESQSGITEIEKEDIRDNIRSTLTRVLKCEKVNVANDTAVLKSSVEKEYGKIYFVSVIERNKTSKEIRIISEESFKILSDVITKLLLSLKVSKKNIILAYKIIKFCTFFKVINKKDDILLEDKIFNNLTKNYCIFNEVLFWELWIEDELDDNEMEILNKLKNLKNEFFFVDEESEEMKQFREIYKNQLDNIRKLMEKIKLNKSLMLSVIDDLCKQNIINDDIKKAQVFEIMKIDKLI